MWDTMFLLFVICCVRILTSTSIFKRKFTFLSLGILEHSKRKELLDQSLLGVKPANSLLSDQ